MKLRSLVIGDEVEALVGHHELTLENWEYLLKYEKGMLWSDYLVLLEDEHHGRNMPTGRVPATFLIAEHEGQLIGRASVRHELNDFLYNYGGHIGYGVRPANRRKGFATRILRQSLDFIKELGVNEVFVTCDDDNVGSYKVIESQGGILENRMNFEGKLKRRYWIKQSDL